MSATPTAAARPKSKSRTTRAAERAAGDGPTLTVVPDPPAPAKTAADVASKLAMVLGQAPVQAAPPSTPDLPPSVIKRAAQTTSGASKVTGEPNPKVITPKVTAAKTTTPKVTQPKTPRVKAPKVSGPVTATATYTTVDRFNAVVTVGDKVHRCEHAARNSHITMGAALTCAGRLLRNHEGGVVSTEIRGRYWGVYQALAEGSEPVGCQCKFGHREQEAAIACAKDQAARVGLVA